MRGPQNAGLLLGKKELIAEAAKNNNPYDGVGRGMKVAKEQIVGMVAAVDWILSQSDEAHGEGVPPARGQDRGDAEGHSDV